MPLPDVKVRIVDADDGIAELPPGEVGEMIMRAPQYMAGYWTTRMKPRRAARRTDGGTRRGCTPATSAYIGRRRLRLHRRSQEGPDQDERLPGVAARDRGGRSRASVGREVGVAGIADAIKGEVVKAWVVLKEGTAASEDDLRSWCRERLAPYKVPATVEFHRSCPRASWARCCGVR